LKRVEEVDGVEEGRRRLKGRMRERRKEKVS
jgi:hypothetical protein